MIRPGCTDPVGGDVTEMGGDARTLLGKLYGQKKTSPPHPWRA